MLVNVMRDDTHFFVAAGGLDAAYSHIGNELQRIRRVENETAKREKWSHKGCCCCQQHDVLLPFR